MPKSRKDLNIHCHSCPVSELCLANGVSPEVLDWLDQTILYVKVFEPGDHLFHSNQKMTHTFAIRSGACKEYSIDKDGKESVREFYTAGDIVGLEYANEKNCPPFNTIATQRTLACMIPIQIIQQPKPSLYPRLFNLICQKLKQQHIYQHTTNAKKRVAAFFIALIDREQRFKKLATPSSPRTIPLQLSNLDISRKIGIAQETLCRVLQELSLNQYLVVKNHLIHFYDLEALKGLAGY